MTIETSDVRSNPNEQIIHAAEKIGTSEIKQKIFKEVHRGKTRIKTVSQIVSKTGLTRKQVLNAAIFLHNNRIIKKTKKNGELAYERDDFFFQNKLTILKLASNKKKRKKYPTKRNPKISLDQIITIAQLQDTLSKAERITTDDINSFEKVREYPLSMDIKNMPMLEEYFQQGLQCIIGEKGIFKDWGGETDDLYTNRILINGKRVYTAFGLKGRATTGVLTPKKMGTQGDQIQRLFRAPADAYFVQYWGQISETIVEQMHYFAIAKASLEGKTIFYGIIDGQDTIRLTMAYSECFPENACDEDGVGGGEGIKLRYTTT